jgi:hypothetical protein
MAMQLAMDLEPLTFKSSNPFLQQPWEETHCLSTLTGKVITKSGFVIPHDFALSDWVKLHLGKRDGMHVLGCM